MKGDLSITSPRVVAFALGSTRQSPALRTRHANATPPYGFLLIEDNTEVVRRLHCEILPTRTLHGSDLVARGFSLFQPALVLHGACRPGEALPEYWDQSRDGRACRGTLRAFPKGDTRKRTWLRKLGEYIAAVVFDEPETESNDPVLWRLLCAASDKPFVLEDFPPGYLFYLLEKTRSDRPNARPDLYLRG